MTELEKIEYTKGFVDKLAEGINPIDGTLIAEGDLLNNVRISRCMYYVSDILRRVIENGGTESKKPAKRGRAPFALDSSARRELTQADEPLRISQVTSLINERVDPETMKSLRSGRYHPVASRNRRARRGSAALGQGDQAPHAAGARPRPDNAGVPGRKLGVLCRAV